ncbi:dihydrodipicolinate synthase family protein [Nonomuraea thailandensis]
MPQSVTPQDPTPTDVAPHNVTPPGDRPSAPRAEVLAAVPAFFDEAGELDLATTKAYFADLAPRVDGVFVCGTTGEFPALERAERRAVVEAALAVFGPERVVVHVGAAATRESVALTRDAVAAGTRRLAALTPYYLPADTGAVLRHFDEVTRAAGRPPCTGTSSASAPA